MKSFGVSVIAVVAAIVISGCSQPKTAWVDPPEVKIIETKKSANVGLINKLELNKKRDAFLIPNASHRKNQITAEDNQNYRSEQLFMEKIRKWEDERSEKSDLIVVPRPVSKFKKSQLNGSKLPFIPDPSYVLEYPEPTELVNLKLRIELLEYRLKSAKLLEKPIYEARLSEIKDELAAAQEEYNKLVLESKQQEKPVIVSNIPVVRPETVIKVNTYNNAAIIQTINRLTQPSANQNTAAAAIPDYSGFSDYNKVEAKTITEASNYLNVFK